MNRHFLSPIQRLLHLILSALAARSQVAAYDVRIGLVDRLGDGVNLLHLHGSECNGFNRTDALRTVG